MNNALIVCPLCPMHCDDVSALQLREGRTGCDVADRRLRAVLRAPDRAATPSDLQQCRKWVADAESIVVSGLALDLETSRAIGEFVRHTGARVDMRGPHAMALDVLAREGWFQTTLGELSARETSVLVIGDVASHWPRMEKRLQSISSVVRWADDEDLPERVAALRRQMAERYIDAPAADLQVTAAAKHFKEAVSMVVLVAPLRESTARSPVLWSAITGLIRERNRVARAAILSFDSSVTVRSVLAANNDPPRWEYSPREASLRIEFTPFAETDSLPARQTIFIGASDRVRGADQCLLPASVPGLHHAGIVIRGDGSVTLPLQSCLPRERPLPTPAEQLRSLIGPVP
ncbi:MAG: hypothetical protein ACO1RT_12715 [Planctomycetaceae bacterium]